MTDNQLHTDNAADPLLGVRSSVLEQMWAERPVVSRIAEAISEQNEIPLVAARVMAGRGVTIDQAPEYLSPSIKQLMPDPNVLIDMDKAVERIVQAARAGEKIAIFGDYDVDGATSTSLLVNYFKSINIKVLYYIPDRLSEGYGPNSEALLQLQKRDVSLVITVDCGTLSYEPLEVASNAGLDVIVIDHHKAETTLPKAVAVVNPNRLDDESKGLEQLAAVGVSFLLAVAVNRALRESGWYDRGIKEPDLRAALDLVALGTICDVVPLTGLNRAFVRSGLQVMARRNNVGLSALSDIGRLTKAPDVYALGFVLGPRVNAGGRVGESNLGTELLTTDDPAKAAMIAEELDQYNIDRKEIESLVQTEATAILEKLYGTRGDPQTLVFVAGEGWHPGVIGIVASRLKEKYNLPTIVIGINEGEAKGSGRSISGVDLGAAIIEAKHNGLLVSGGGHAMAAGLTATPDNLEALEAFLKDHMAKAVVEAHKSKQFMLDGVVSIGGANVALLEALQDIGPFGAGNANPRFAIADVTVVKADRVGADHVRAIIKSRDGSSMKLMSFRQADEPMGQMLLKGLGQRFHVAGRLKIDDWSGVAKVEMTLEDLAPV